MSTGIYSEIRFLSIWLFVNLIEVSIRFLLNFDLFKLDCFDFESFDSLSVLAISIIRVLNLDADYIESKGLINRGGA